MIKECKKHGLTEFVARNDNRIVCKKCVVDAVQKRRNNVKIDAVKYKGGKCQNCGYNKYVGALEFHHISGDKDFGIASKGYTRSWSSVMIELDKCIMLCSNCHKEAHAGIIDVSEILSTHTTITKAESPKNYCIDCGIEIEKYSLRCFECNKVSRRKQERPSLDVLMNDIKTLNYSGTGRKYGVAGGTIKKWIKNYNE